MKNEMPVCNPLAAFSDLEAPFSHISGKTHSRQETLALVAGIIQKLQAFGIKSGSSLAVHAATSPESVALLFACFEMGVRAVLLNPRLSDTVLAKQLRATEAVAVVCAAPLSFTDLPQHQIRELCAHPTPVPYKPVDWNLDSEAIVAFTSGSEGEPKGVVHTLRSMLTAATSSNAVTGFSDSDIWLLSLPVYHLGGLQILLRAAISGGQVVALSAQDTDSLLAALTEHEITFMSLVPTQLQDLLAVTSLEKFKARSGKILLAGAPSSPELLDQIRKLQLCIIPCYGMTETAAHCTALPAPFSLSKLQTVGRALPGTRVTILDEADQPVPQGQKGRITIETPQLARAYLAMDGTQTMLRNPLHTADLGFFDSDGYLHIAGRADRVFISGGENISALEIENQIYKSGLVHTVAVVAIPHVRWGERPLLFAVLKENAQPAALEEWMDTELPALHRPEQIIYQDSLPLTAIGKIDYPALTRSAINVVRACFQSASQEHLNKL